MTTVQVVLGATEVLTTSANPVLGMINRYNANTGNLTPVLPLLSGLNVGANTVIEKDTLDNTTHTITATCAGSDTFDDGTLTEILESAADNVTLQVVSILGVKYWKVMQRSGITATDIGALTSGFSMSGFKITDLANGTATTDAANYGQLISLVNGLDIKNAVRFASTGSETYTISGGAVTSISGTSFGGGSPAVGNRLLIKNAPTSSGAGTADSNATGTSQPANGVYTVTNATTNLTVARASDADADAEVIGGLTVWVNAGTHSDSQWTLTTDDTITVNTTALTFTQTDRNALTFSGGVAKSGNAVTREALTGDVTASAGSNATTIAAAAVSLAKMANLAANSVIGNSTGSGATPTAVPMTSAATASTVAVRDSSANISHNNVFQGFTTTATAAGTTTMTIASTPIQIWTGSSTQTVKLPTTSVPAGGQYFIINQSSGAVTVQSSGANTITILAAGTSGTFTAVIATPTTAANWDSRYWGEIITSGKSLSASATLALAGTDATTMTFPSTSATIARTDALQTFTGVQTFSSAPSFGVLPTGAGVASAATASTLAARDANAQLVANAFVQGFTSTATAGGTTTMTIASTPLQVWTGSSAQTVKLPTTAVAAGQQYLIVNQSSGAVTVQSSGANTVVILAAGTSGLFTAVTATPTTAGNWDGRYWGEIVTSGKSLSASATLTLAGTDGKTLTVNNSLTLSGTDATVMTFPATSATIARTDALQTFTGVQTFSSAPSFGALPTGAGVASAATASTLAARDANAQLLANAFVAGFTTTATAGGTTNMTISSTQSQVWTGTLAQTVTLPTTSVAAGQQYYIVNLSTGAVTVQSSGANNIVILAAGTGGLFTARVVTPTTAANWDGRYFGEIVASGKSLTVNNTLTFSGTDATTMTFPATTGTVATLGQTGQRFTGSRVDPQTNTVTSSATPSINTDTTDEFTITALAANITSMTTNLTGAPVNGQKLMIRIKDDGTARTITWGTSFQSSGVATLLATTVISKTHHIGLVYDSTAAKWICLAVDGTGY